MARRIAVVLGTRPEIIKLSPLIAALAPRGDDLCVVHTGQHYSPDLDAVFFTELALPEPTVRLTVGSSTQARQLARLVEGVGEVLEQRRPDVVVVQGDTNSGLAGALCAAKLAIPVAHVEAGLRSHDWRMPEEANRRAIDALATLLFPPTEAARDNLLAEGVGSAQFVTATGPRRQHVEVTGNTVVDAMQRALALPAAPGDVLADLGVESGAYCLATSHRAENVDDPEFLDAWVTTLAALADRGLRPVWLVHPRSRRALVANGLVARAESVALLHSPLGYRDSLALQQRAGLVLTDSGGVQEEACILGVPCVVARRTSDRPETIAVGAGLLGGTTAPELEAAIDAARALPRPWAHPFGDGHATERILAAIAAHLP